LVEEKERKSEKEKKRKRRKKITVKGFAVLELFIRKLPNCAF